MEYELTTSVTQTSIRCHDLRQHPHIIFEYILNSFSSKHDKNISSMTSIFTTLKRFFFPPTLPAQPNSPPTIDHTSYRYDTESSATHTLPDGRKLGYAQYGVLTGKPIFYMHGLPGSRMEAAIFDDTAKEVGARIIAVERPGCGLSDPYPGWILKGFPRDVESLARSLGVREFGILVRLPSLVESEILKCADADADLGEGIIRWWSSCPRMRSLFPKRTVKMCLPRFRIGSTRYRLRGRSMAPTFRSCAWLSIFPCFNNMVV